MINLINKYFLYYLVHTTPGCLQCNIFENWNNLCHFIAFYHYSCPPWWLKERTSVMMFLQGCWMLLNWFLILKLIHGSPGLLDYFLTCFELPFPLLNYSDLTVIAMIRGFGWWLILQDNFFKLLLGMTYITKIHCITNSECALLALSDCFHSLCFHLLEVYMNNGNRNWLQKLSLNQFTLGRHHKSWLIWFCILLNIISCVNGESFYSVKKSCINSVYYYMHRSAQLRNYCALWAFPVEHLSVLICFFLKKDLLKT